ncbi:MAG TPA: asparagine synthase-related protein [Pseudolabrys sp.]|nr:asparagine synthase-related protein [Pseudolabrys sp.]
MSGIAGLIRFDGRNVTRRDLERAANALNQYGPDRVEIIARDNYGLAHALMRMTPADRFDRQPYQDGSGSIITADLRLDNRDNLLAQIGMSPAEAAEWPDSRLLLSSWQKLGDDIWPTLRGPFAVAIWDPRSRCMTLARDHLGLNVVTWHRGRGFLVFASMPNALFAFDDVPRELCEKKLADFLVLNHADHATTMYRNVFRVPPAYVLHVKPDGSIAQRRYWSPADIKDIRLRSDSAYAEGLRDCLDRAVRRQMRSIHPIGCLLSGGLDSSSVSVLAAHALGEKNQRLAAFTGVPGRDFNGPVPDGCYADETPYVEAIRKKAGNIDIDYVHTDACDDFAQLERFFTALDGPVRNPTNFGWTMATLQRARAQGRRVLLGGLHGNCTISWDGWSQASGHLARGRLLLAYRQWRQFYRNTPYSSWTALRKLLIEPLIPGRLGDWTRRHRSATWREHAPIRAEFAAEMAVESRARTVGHDFLYRMRRDERVKGLAQVDYLGDWQAAEKAFTGVEVRDPTADIDVVSYCFGIPTEQYLAEGIDRSLIRRAMWGLLPEPVLTNRLSGLQGADWHRKLEARRGELAQELNELSKSALVRRAIDLGRLERAVKDWPRGGWHKAEVFHEYNLALTRGLAGGRFIRWIESAN